MATPFEFPLHEKGIKMSPFLKGEIEWQSHPIEGLSFL